MTTDNSIYFTLL